MKEKNKHGGAQEESRQIKKHADQWCKDNDYPLQKKDLEESYQEAKRQTEERKSKEWVKGYNKWKTTQDV